MQLKDIAKRQEIPLSYLKQIVATLVNGGMLRSIRGVGGGVFLARNPKEINLREVLQLLEGVTPLAECNDKPEVCERAEICVTRDLWCEIDTAANKILETTSLQDLVERHLEKQARQQVIYQI